MQSMQAYMYLLFSRHTALCNLSSEFVSKRKEIRQKFSRAKHLYKVHVIL